MVKHNTYSFKLGMTGANKIFATVLLFERTDSIWTKCKLQICTCPFSLNKTFSLARLLLLALPAYIEVIHFEQDIISSGVPDIFYLTTHMLCRFENTSSECSVPLRLWWRSVVGAV